MARKRPDKTRAGAKTAKAGASSKATKKARKSAAARKPASKSKAAKPAKQTSAPRVKATRASKAARKAAKKVKAGAVKTSARKGAAKKTRPAKAAVRTPAPAPTSPQPSPRRTAPRISAGRRATPRKTASREALAKKTLTQAKAPARKPARKAPARKTAAKRAGGKHAAAKPAPGTRGAGKVAGKTARSRLVARASEKLAPPVLRDAARRPVLKPTAPRPPKPASRKASGPFRLHALGIREAHATDRPRIATLLTEAFSRADEAEIVDRLRADGDMAMEFVAEYEGEIIGHVAFSRVEASIDGRALKALALAPLAVSPGRRGRGVGSALVGAGLEAARTAGHAAVFVLGDVAYYERFGFSADAAARFDSRWTDALLALELEAGALAGAAGSLIHPPALRF